MKSRTVLLGALGYVVLLGACGTSEPIGFQDRDASVGLVAPAEGDASEAATLDATIRACARTDCPAPYATCADPDAPLGEARLPCQVDLLSDSKHCGACGNVCPTLALQLNAQTSCVKGVCRAACTNAGFADCNATVDDGCETDLNADAANCGACGRACGAGVRCVAGACGCPPGKTDCNGECVDLKSDDKNCSACGRACKPPFGSDAGVLPPLPPHMYYGCEDAKCPKPKCVEPWADCNGVLADGCEVNVEKQIDVNRDLYDPKNCGACGVTCGPNQLCVRPFRQPLACICGAGLEACHGAGTYTCANLETDPTNCGSCGFRCPGRNPNLAYTEEGKHGQFECLRSRCSFECRAPWTDCNRDESDGCESNVQLDPNNCGACGAKCAPGQLCLDGKCATQECEAGVTR